MGRGRFEEFLGMSESYTVAKSSLRALLAEAVADFPKEPSFFDRLSAGADIFMVYAGKVEAWKRRWFGV